MNAHVMAFVQMVIVLCWHRQPFKEATFVGDVLH